MKRIISAPENSYYPPYARDVRNLLVLFEKKKSLDIGDLKFIWKEMGFSSIHDAVPQECTYSVFLQELFTTLLGYILKPDNTHSLHIKAGAIYALYFLYESQKVIPKIRIDVSPKIFKAMMNLRETAKEKKAVHLYQILLYLQEKKTLNYCSVVEIDPTLSSHITPSAQIRNVVNRDFVTGLVNDVRLEIFAKKYKNIKKEFFESLSGDDNENENTPYNVVNDDFPKDLSEILRNFSDHRSERLAHSLKYQRKREIKLINEMEKKNSRKFIKSFNRSRMEPLSNVLKSKREATFLSTALDLLPGTIKDEDHNDHNMEQLRKRLIIEDGQDDGEGDVELNDTFKKLDFTPILTKIQGISEMPNQTAITNVSQEVEMESNVISKPPQEVLEIPSIIQNNNITMDHDLQEIHEDEEVTINNAISSYANNMIIMKRNQLLIPKYSKCELPLIIHDYKMSAFKMHNVNVNVNGDGDGEYLQNEYPSSRSKRGFEKINNDENIKTTKNMNDEMDLEVFPPITQSKKLRKRGRPKNKPQNENERDVKPYTIIESEIIEMEPPMKKRKTSHEDCK